MKDRRFMIKGPYDKAYGLSKHNVVVGYVGGVGLVAEKKCARSWLVSVLGDGIRVA